MHNVLVLREPGCPGRRGLAFDVSSVQVRHEELAFGVGDGHDDFDDGFAVLVCGRNLHLVAGLAEGERPARFVEVPPEGDTIVTVVDEGNDLATLDLQVDLVIRRDDVAPGAFVLGGDQEPVVVVGGESDALLGGDGVKGPVVVAVDIRVIPAKLVEGDAIAVVVDGGVAATSGQGEAHDECQGECDDLLHLKSLLFLV